MRGKELEWVGTSLSDVDSVKGLLKLRKDFDMIFENKYFTGDNDPNSASTHVADQMEEVICTYADLDKIISRTEFTLPQQAVLDRYMFGMDVLDIADELDVDVRSVDKVLDALCNSIVEEGLREWRRWSYVHKMNMKTKKCSKCQEDLPATEEFFSPNEQGKDGFRNFCKKCR